VILKCPHCGTNKGISTLIESIWHMVGVEETICQLVLWLKSQHSMCVCFLSEERRRLYTLQSYLFWSQHWTFIEQSSDRHTFSKGQHVAMGLSRVSTHTHTHTHTPHTHTEDHGGNQDQWKVFNRPRRRPRVSPSPSLRSSQTVYRRDLWDLNCSEQ